MSCESSGSARAPQVTLSEPKKRAVAPTKPLFVPLCSEPYWRFVRGNKTVEIRQAEGKWNPRQVVTGRPALVRRGYSTPDEFQGVVGRVVFAPGFRALPVWAVLGADLSGEPRLDYYDPERRVVAFEILQKEDHLEDV